MSWRARELLAASDQVLTGQPRLLRAAGAVWGFHDGARWMRLVMNALRDEHVPLITGNLQSLGWKKYIICSIGATIWLAICIFLNLWAFIPLSIAVFYLLESRFVFIFPLRADQPTNRLPHTLLVHRAGGTMRVVLTIMAIAFVMLFGGLIGKGFLRSWCLGCGAVVIWYEHARLASQNDAV